MINDSVLSNHSDKHKETLLIIEPEIKRFVLMTSIRRPDTGCSSLLEHVLARKQLPN